METWLYTTGSNGSTTITDSVLAGKTINGRVYRDGKAYRPSATPGDKEYGFNAGTGTISFAMPFDGDENVDIPYE